MRALPFFMILFLCLANSLFGQKPGYINESKLYTFYSHYWFEMHHFFKQAALIQKVKKESIIPEEVVAKLQASELELFQEVIDYYDKEHSERDLRTSDYMAAFKQWIIEQDVDQLTGIPDSFQLHCHQLEKINPLYKKYLWPIHQEAIEQVLNNNMSWILETEETIIQQLSNWTRSFWPNKKIRVDIVFYAKASENNLRVRPYTSLFPTHLVMNADSSADVLRGNWLELLYHESSHSLISGRYGFVSGTLKDVANMMDKRPPRSLWHAYLFYFSGIATQRILQEKYSLDGYELYMKRNNVFSWYLPYMEEYLLGYMEGKSSLHDASKQIISNFYSDLEAEQKKKD